MGDISELVASIRDEKIIEPILVRLKDGVYEIVCGIRRVIAAKAANLKSVPAIIANEMSDEEVARFSFIENIHKKDLSDYEIGNWLLKYAKIFRVTSEYELARRVKKSVAWVSRHIDHARFLDEIASRQQLRLEVIMKLTERQTRVVRTAPEERKHELVKKLIEEPRTSVRTLEDMIKPPSEGAAREAAMWYPEGLMDFVRSLPSLSAGSEMMQKIEVMREVMCKCIALLIQFIQERGLLEEAINWMDQRWRE